MLAPAETSLASTRSWAAASATAWIPSEYLIDVLSRIAGANSDEGLDTLLPAAGGRLGQRRRHDSPPDNQGLGQTVTPERFMQSHHEKSGTRAGQVSDTRAHLPLESCNRTTLDLARWF